VFDGTLFSIPASGGTITTLRQPPFVSPEAVLAMNASSLVWSDMSGVYSANKDGSGFHSLSSQSTSSIAADGANAYWAYPGTTNPGTAAIEQAPIGGGSATVLVKFLSNPGALSLSQSTLYFADNYEVYAEPTMGGSEMPLTGQMMMGNATSASADGSGYYFVVGSEIFSLPLAGGTPKKLATGLGAPFNLLTDATAIYWIDQNIMMLAK
jgi:hypothetical protein